MPVINNTNAILMTVEIYTDFVFLEDALTSYAAIFTRVWGRK